MPWQTGPRVLPFPAAGQIGHAAPQPRVSPPLGGGRGGGGLARRTGRGRMLFDGGVDRTTTTPTPRSRRRPHRRRPGGARRCGPLHVEPAVNDDQFLSEIELATAAPRTRELRAIYAFTLEEPRDVPRAVGKD